MRPVPFICPTVMARSIEWFRTVIRRARLVSKSPYWSELEIDDDVLALHAAGSIAPGGGVRRLFVADERGSPDASR